MAKPEIEAMLLFAIIDGANQHRALKDGAYPVEELIEATMSRFRTDATK